MVQAAITEKQVEQFPDLSFKWLLESVDNLRTFLQIVCPDIVNQIDFTDDTTDLIDERGQDSSGVRLW